jgi:Protein of unknown function (DUF3616)
MRKTMQSNIFAIWALLATILPCAARAASIKSSAVEIASPLTDDKGQPSNDISGVSCLEPQGATRICLVIDDQGRLAQAATFEGSTLTGRGKIRLIGKGDALPDIVGKQPTVDNCSNKNDRFKDLDGEAVARDANNFYVAGSHGCSRHSNKFHASSFILARIPNDVVMRAAAAGSDTIDEKGPVATSYRLSEALLVAPTVKASFAQDLMTQNGLNIEGLAVVGGKLYAGLRAPILGKNAFLVVVDVDRLFDAARPIGEADVSEIALDLGGRGVRDLAVLADGRLLVLAGPAQSDDLSFALYAVEPASKAVTPIADLVDVPPDAKAEALHILAQDAAALDLLILFDGAKSGAPRRYAIGLN